MLDKNTRNLLIKEKYQNMGELLSESDEVLVISKCFYGGFSPFVKNIFDRSISYVHPYFVTRNGEMHHKRRYDHEMDLKVWFYGEEITDQEKHTSEKLLRANSINLECDVLEINYVQATTEIRIS